MFSRPKYHSGTDAPRCGAGRGSCARGNSYPCRRGRRVDGPAAKTELCGINPPHAPPWAPRGYPGWWSCRAGLLPRTVSLAPKMVLVRNVVLGARSGARGHSWHPEPGSGTEKLGPTEDSTQLFKWVPLASGASRGAAEWGGITTTGQLACWMQPRLTEPKRTLVMPR